MNERFAVALLAALLPGLSIAQVPQNYQCSYGDLQRRVEILYETGVTVPCEVHYYKDTEAPGEREVLWRSLHESGYCESKTQEFIEKLLEIGWDCSRTDDVVSDTVPDAEDDSGVDADPVQADDTEALAPAAETTPPAEEQ
jgi:hypothetical protein